MSETRHGLFAPLNIAGYVAWAAIGYELIYTGWGPPPWLAAPTPSWVLGALHLAFLAMFATVITREDLPQALRRTLVLAQVALVFVLMALARASALPILGILCAIQVVHLWAPRPAVALMLAFNVAMYLMYRGVWNIESPLISTVMHASFQGFAALTAWFAISSERSRDALAQANADLLATRSLLAESVRDSERLRLSRELHDVAGHKLTALKLNLAALARDPRFAGVEAVPLCARLADELLADIRGVVQQMRLHDGLDLRNAVQALAAPFPTPRVHLALADDARVFDVAQAEAVLRTVQEGLTNAARHSGAGNVWVALRRDGGRIELEIRDDGRGGDGLRVGNGLTGMRERLQAVGGDLRIDAGAEGGVRLSAQLPVAA
jgi:signal transduction histidine kinase